MNPAAALATVFVDELIRCGTREVVVSPGSRSAPLALAFHAAAADGRIRLHVRIDERSAGYLALGLAKVSGVVVPVVTTSGTAAVNLGPAVVEAHYSGVPLILLTADRPPELRGAGANQTIDQIKLFGDAVSHFVEVGLPDHRFGQNAYWRSLVARAVASASGALSGDRGPVHLNIALPGALESGDEEQAWLEPLAGRAEQQPWTVVDPIERVAVTASLPARTLVVVGDTSAAMSAGAMQLAQANAWPVISEPTGNCRFGAHAISTGMWLLQAPDWIEANKPEHVLVVGRPTLSRAVVSLLTNDEITVSVVATGSAWADAPRSARAVFATLPIAVAQSTDAGWLQTWQEAETRARSAIDETLDQHRSSEQALVRDLAGGLRADTLLVAGSSLPIRHLFGCAQPRGGLTVVGNRGAAGIDGTVSTAVGAALAWQRLGHGSAVTLLGDLTFLHDSTGLMVGPDEPLPELSIVVINNDGGGIFEGLEQAKVTDRKTFDRIFGTPHGVDLAALCGASATPHTRVNTSDELLDVVLDPRSSLQVVEVVADRRLTAEVNRLLAARVSSAVERS